MTGASAFHKNRESANPPLDAGTLSVVFIFVDSRLPAVQGVDHQVVDHQDQRVERPSGDVGLAAKIEHVHPKAARPLAG
jgi:hypothetical protein